MQSLIGDLFILVFYLFEHLYFIWACRFCMHFCLGIAITPSCLALFCIVFLKCELFVFMFYTGKQFGIPQCNALELACLCATINQNLSWLIVGYDCQLYAKLHINCTLKIYTMRLCDNVTNKIKLQYVLHCIMHNVSHTILSDAVSNILVLYSEHSLCSRVLGKILFN